MNKYLTVIVLLLLSSCCRDGIEVNRYILTDYEKESIPYLTDETLKFSHSNGFEFNLSVTSKQTEFQKTETYDCSNHYLTYETLIVDLFSATPELYINLEIAPKEISPNVMITINKYIFYIDITLEPDIDNLTINGNKFRNIYQADSHTSDPSVIIPKQVLYNREVGIIQITMTDNEKITIKK